MHYIAVFLVALVLAEPAPADAVRVSDRLTIVQVSEGVWLHTSWHYWGEQQFPSNGLIVRRPEGLIVINSAWGTEATEELLEWIDETFDQTVVGAIVTHFHDDSAGGASVLLERRVPVFGHPLTKTLVPDHVGSAMSSPDRFEVGGVVTFHGLEVFYPGAGHAVDNVVVWVEEARVLFGGCLIRSPSFAGRGNISDADLTGWPAAVERVRERYLEAVVVVPGHGPPGSKALLTHTIDLFPGQRDAE